MKLTYSILALFALVISDASAVARNCKELQDQGMDHDGPSTIYPFPNHPETSVSVLCDQTTQGGGWTVITRRDDTYYDRNNFARTFEEYADGFGELDYDFYIGNEVIHALTGLQGHNELWVTIEDTHGETGYAHYGYFHVGARLAILLPPYMMGIGLYEGTIGDGMEYHNGMGFSTMDQDHDIDNDLHCSAVSGGGGWWSRDCYRVLLTGPYGTGYFHWSSINSYYTLSKAQMMVRPSTCSTT
ncbi:unnamed protein product [Meganyctiphanes norvegica]|uniref:Fibrinogen C-terminal domain-containing protein n=1 Tax=Meganyctiphanes norvegica TaxID=48144 RepID=A0AAV2QZM3_MEGNR